jgi:hypothetical protein
MMSMGQEVTAARQYLDSAILGKWKVCLQELASGFVMYRAAAQVIICRLAQHMISTS